MDRSENSPAPQTGERRRALGMELDPLTIREALDRCARAVASRESNVIGVLNAAKLVKLAVSNDEGGR